MIKRLRIKFIKIASLTVAAVMLLLVVILNTANFISTDRKLNQTIDMISSNEGRIPMDRPDFKNNDPMRMQGKPFDEETPFSTRYFVLTYTAQGELVTADLDRIAAVTEQETDEYLSLALKKGEGSGYVSGYKYSITQQSDGNFRAIFLNDYQEMRSVYTVLVASICAAVICIALITVLIVLFSKKAIDPVVKSSQQQKQFITDASHELKTPITVIATSLSVLEMEVGKQKWIDKAKNQTEKLKDLVNSLVSLSKMDEEDSPLKMHDFNVSEALSETAESFADFAETQGHKLNIDIENGITYCGDEYAVRQLSSILIDNAVKYADVGSDIDFILKKDKRGIAISTRNKCESIDESDLDKLFDRFYRADKSRSQSKGFGIGLSLARSIAEGHNGSVSAELEENNTIVFTAKLK